MVEDAIKLGEAFQKYGPHLGIALLAIANGVQWVTGRTAYNKLVDTLTKQLEAAGKTNERLGGMAAKFELTAREMVDVVARFAPKEAPSAEPRRASRGGRKAKSGEGGESPGRSVAHAEGDAEGD